MPWNIGDQPLAYSFSQEIINKQTNHIMFGTDFYLISNVTSKECHSR